MSARTTSTVVPTLTREGDKATLVFDAGLLDTLAFPQGTPVHVGVRGGQLVVEAAPVAPSPDDRAVDFEHAMRSTAAENAELFRRLAK
jgi:hypothetical protein